MTIDDIIERVGRVTDAGELDRLQAAIDQRRRELAGDAGEPQAAPPPPPTSTVLERRPHANGVLQLEMRGQAGPYWYFHYREGGKQKSLYIGKTDTPGARVDERMG